MNEEYADAPLDMRATEDDVEPVAVDLNEWADGHATTLL